MSVPFPQIDYPRGSLPRGGSDIWDTPQASVVLADDMFYADVFVDGTLVATEVGQDTAAAFGKITVKGAFSVTESGVDTAFGSGKVLIKGVLSKAEVGQDTAAASGDVFVKGSLVAIEFAADTANFTAGVEIHGDFTVSEVGVDSFTSLSLPPVTIGIISVSVAAVTLLAKKLTRISEQSATIHKLATLAAKVTNYG